MYVDSQLNMLGREIDKHKMCIDMHTQNLVAFMEERSALTRQYEAAVKS